MRNFVYSIFVVGVASGFSLPHEGVYKLDIIHYNDFHARFEETSVSTPTCWNNAETCLGGFPRLYHEIQVLRQEKPDAILLNAGDSFQGTYWYTLLRWNVTQEFMNLLPHDAHAIGNHEFDDGPEGLVPYLRALKAPVLAANMDCSNEPILQGLYQNHLVIERKGRKIGLIGLITQATATLSAAGKVVFTDPGEATRREAEDLTKQGVDIIILLSHCGLEIDKMLAREHGEYIDVIVGGHSHSLLWNGDAPSEDEIAGPYPVFIENSADRKHKVLIVQASAFTKYMGNLTVDFDIHGEYVNWEGGPIFLDRSIPEDEQIKSKLAPYADLVHRAQNVPVGVTESALHFQQCTFGECTLGDLLVDSFNARAKAVVKSMFNYLSLNQRGNIKSSIPKGNITKGEIFELLPYRDNVMSCELQGKYVLEALERSVSDAWDMSPFKGPWLLQVSGLRVTYNVSLPEGHRVTSVYTDDSNILNNDSYYQVTGPAYLLNGGDGFEMLNNKRNVHKIGRDQEIIESYIRSRSPLDIKLDGRIVINT